MYILQSNIDNKKFQVNQNVIDTSMLLKNLCGKILTLFLVKVIHNDAILELTEITDPIILNCSSECLDIFTNLINHYDTITDIHDAQYKIELFKNITDKRITEMVKEFAYLDSDFLIDSIADIILDRIKGMSGKEMQQYFGLDDDFSVAEKFDIDAFRLEFLISLNTKNLKFPFVACTNFNILKNKFYTPMNVILARIIQRSNEKIAFKLSIINKTLKNENDRYPIKVTKFNGGNPWLIKIDINPNFSYVLEVYDFDDSYFNSIKVRKLLPYHETNMLFNDRILPTKIYSTSLDFVIPEKNPTLTVYFNQNPNQIYNFEIQRCPFSSIFYSFTFISINFDEFYQQLIAKDFSKEIKIRSSAVFNLFAGEFLHIFKKQNASKFHEIHVISLSDSKILPTFKNFVLNYMDDDGIIRSEYKLFEIPNVYNRKKREYIYQVSMIKELL